MTWLCVAHRSELAKAGDYVLIGPHGDQILAHNDGEKITISDNVCLHRGARIFSGTHGNAQVKCPYHGFEGDKALKSTGLTTWVGDFLFAGDGTVQIEDQLGEMMPLIERASQRITARHSFEGFFMPCEWTVAVENTLEDLHVPTVHPYTFGKLRLKLKGMERIGNNSIAEYEIGDARIRRHLETLAQAFDDVDPVSYFHIFMWPAVCLSSVGGFTTSLQHYFPSMGATKFYTRLYKGRAKTLGPTVQYFFDEASLFNRQVFEEDSAICSTVKGTGHSLTEAEKRVQWFREALHERI